MKAAADVDDDVLLHVDGLGFAYPGSEPTLHRVDLRVRRGSCVGLLGANGTGKSTLLGAITASISGQQSGTVHVNAELGYATQDVALYRHLTVSENLVHSARLTTRRWQVHDLVEGAVELYGLDRIARTKVQKLSGGQARLAHIANAFVQRPALRLLDEPTTALDFETRQHLVETVRNWRNEGIATLVTAHYPEDIEDLCTDLVVLAGGTMRQLGSLDEYLSRSAAVSELAWIDDPEEGVAHAPIPGDVRSLDGLVAAAESLGVESHRQLHSVQVRPARLRDILVRDPSLRDSIEVADQ